MPWLPPYRRRILDPFKPADVVVYREGDKAVAVDRSGSRVAASTDHAVVIQTAIDRVADDGGGKIYIAPGTYTVSRALVMRSKVALVGAGIDVTIIKLADGANDNLLKAPSSVSNVMLADMTFDGNGANQSDGAARSDRVVLRFNAGISNFLFYRIRVTGARYGAGASVSYVADRGKIISSIFEGNGVPGAAWPADGLFLNGRRVEIVNTRFEGNTDVGLAMDNCQEVTVLNSIFASNGIAGFTYWNASDSRPAPVALVFIGNVVVSNTRYAAYIGKAAGLTKSVEEIVIVGNVFRLNGPLELRDGAVHVLLAANRIRATEIKLDDVYDVIIQDNIITDVTNGIEFRSGTPGNVVIKNNKFIAVTNPVVKTVEPVNTVIRGNEGYPTENSGRSLFSGDGATTQFVIPHGLVAAPSRVRVTPCSADAAGQFYVTVDDANIYVNYLSAPPAGTDNICLYWEAEA